MHPPLKPIALGLGLLAATSSAFAADDEAAPITVSATRIAYPEAEAPYASEVHTRAMIEQSGAQSLVDYLAQHSSLSVSPYFGNRFTPQLDMRGYGAEAGHQNIAITLDGQRLNNIDLQPQLLGGIPLASIDRIEITKGTGSVMQGDGAMAGSIQIHTRPYNGTAAQAYMGTQGTQGASVSAGRQEEYYGISISADHSSNGGYSEPDSTGHRDASDMRNEQASLSIRPFQPLWLHLDAGSTRIDTRYPGPLTLAQFNGNPAQSAGATYTHQLFASDRWHLGGDYQLSESLKLSLNQHQENKQSEFLGDFPFKASYDYTSDDMALVYNGSALDLTAGMQSFDGTRRQSTDHTSKDNTGYYLQAAYHLGDTTLSAGARRENVRYAYVPTSGDHLSSEHNLNAWDLGLNQRLNERYTLFANLNQSFQAPDIDRFFNLGSFNGFIAPAQARTLTAGLNRIAPGNRFKLAFFRANLDNEIYFRATGPFSGINTNIDRSHKYGVEAQQFWQASANLQLTANYAYTRAIIDQEDQGGGAFNGKDLPGVSRHTLSLSGTYAFTKQSDLTVSHSWRSSSFAIGDFTNSNAQRQKAYNSTNLAYRYRSGALEYFAAVQNLFAYKNGTWTGDDSIYPINFARSALLGIKVRF